MISDIKFIRSAAESGSLQYLQINYCLSTIPLTMDEPGIPWPHFNDGCICEPLHASCSSSGDASQQTDNPQPEATDSSAERPEVLLDTTLQKLQASSNTGCWFCSILLAGVRIATENQLSSNEDGTTRIIASDPYQSPVPFMLSIVSASDNLDDCPSYEFYVPRKFYNLGKDVS